MELSFYKCGFGFWWLACHISACLTGSVDTRESARSHRPFLDLSVESRGVILVRLTDSDSDLNLKERLPSLVEVPIIGILRQCPPDRVRDVVTAATGSGLTTIEVTFDSVNPGAQIRSLVEAFPEMTVGAGTILDSTQARAAIQGVMSNRQPGNRCGWRPGRPSMPTIQALLIFSDQTRI